MTDKAPRCSLRQWTLLHVLAVPMVLLLVDCLGPGCGLARAAIAVGRYESDFGKYPTRKGKYASDGGTSYGSGVPTEMLSMRLIGPDDPKKTVLLPPPGTSQVIDSFFDIFTELRVGETPVTIDSFFDVTLKVSDSGRSTESTKIWDTEIVSMDLKGASPAASVAMRISPSVPSLGQHSVTPLPDGTAIVDSFFDIFTELSVDGGPFVPAAGPVRLELTAIVPEPSSLLLTAAALAALAIGTRRRRRGVAGGS